MDERGIQAANENAQWRGQWWLLFLAKMIEKLDPTSQFVAHRLLDQIQHLSDVKSEYKDYSCGRRAHGIARSSRAAEHREIWSAMVLPIGAP
jgi:hypothetical protein